MKTYFKWTGEGEPTIVAVIGAKRWTKRDPRWIRIQSTPELRVSAKINVAVKTCRVLGPKSLGLV